jgi:superfamily II DNA or RNA helicase
MKLRDYQQETIERIGEAFNEGFSAPLAVLATGLGKTVIFSEYVRQFLRESYKRVLVLAHRAELIWQAKAKIEAICGCSVGVEMGEFRATTFGFFKERVIVSTIQTQISGKAGAGRMRNFNADEFGLLIIDEAHHAVSPSYKRVINYYRESGARILGVTATPDRGDKKALGAVFDVVAKEYDVGDGVREGWLTPIEQRIVTILGLDFSKMRTTAGDLNGGDLAEEMERESNLYGVADATVKIAGDRKTLIFCASVKQTERLTEVINRYKADSAVCIDGRANKEERAQVLREYHEGKYQFLVNCALFTEGFDEPDVACVVFARPTKSRALYAQMLGRGTRPHSSVANLLGLNSTSEQRKAIIARCSKPSVLVLDFVGNCGRHKLVTSFDILGSCGSQTYSDEVVKRAKKLSDNAQKAGAPMLTNEALEKAKAELEEKKRIEMAKRAGLKADARYSVQEVDPFDMYNIQRPIVRGWGHARKPSNKQIDALHRFRIPNPEKLNNAEATAILSECIKRAAEGRPSLNQDRLLKQLGILYPVRTFEEASAIISQKLKNKGR